MNTWNERLNFALKARNMKMADLVRATGVTAPSVSAWINGATKKIEGENALKVCASLGIHYAWLFYGTGPSGLEGEKTPGVRYLQVLTYDQGVGVEPLPAQVRTIPASTTYGDNTFAIVVRGHDMEPDFRPGELVIIDRDADVVPGCYVLAEYNGHGVFRKYRSVGEHEYALAPINHDYPQLSSRERNCRIAGVAVNHIRTI